MITGGLGYIGGRTALYLRKKVRDVNIILTTRKISGKIIPDWAKSFTVSEMELCDSGSIIHCLEQQPIDAIIHLAAMNDTESLVDPERALKTNAVGTYNLLKTARDQMINRFIYFSTFHVYGKISESIITEKSHTRACHPYGITHRAAEDWVNYFSHYYGMNTLILRVSNAFGYPADKEIDRWNLLANDLCKQAITTGKMVLKSNGRQMRNFITLHDVVRTVYHFLYRIPEKWKDGLYNVGGNLHLTVYDFALKIADVFKKKYEKSIPIEITDTCGTKKAEKPFAYSIEKLLNTDFNLEGEFEMEILRTLDICEDFANE